MWEDNRKLMTPIHSECLNHARENEYAQVRYAQEIGKLAIRN